LAQESEFPQPINRYQMHKKHSNTPRMLKEYELSCKQAQQSKRYQPDGKFAPKSSARNNAHLFNSNLICCEIIPHFDGYYNEDLLMIRSSKLPINFLDNW
jgi:hypothetical protein